jgi:hypothetical protein
MKVSGAVAMADDPGHAFGMAYPTEAQMEYVRASKSNSERMDRSIEVAALAAAGPSPFASYAEHYHSEGTEIRYWTKANGEQYKTVVTRCDPALQPDDMDSFKPSVVEIECIADVIYSRANNASCGESEYCSPEMAWDAAVAVLKAIRAP